MQNNHIIKLVVCMNYIQKFKASSDPQKVNHHLKLAFDKKLVAMLLITLAIPITIVLSSQQQDMEKHASEPTSSRYKGFIIEYKEGPVSVTRSIGIAYERPIAERKIDLEAQHLAAKKNILGILGKSSYGATSTNTSPAGNANSSSSVEVMGEYKYGFNGIALNISDSEAQKLLNESPYVQAVYKNLEVEALLLDAVQMVGAKKVWEVVKDSQGRVIDGKGVNVAIIDTGVDYRHADLGKSSSGQMFNSRVVGGYDFANTIDVNEDGDYDDPGEKIDLDPMDDNGHGTHVAGIIGSNGSIKGIAPGVNIYAYKALGAGGGGNLDDIQDGIEYAIGSHFDGDSTNDINIINISAGRYCNAGYTTDCGPDASLSQMVDNASNVGIVVVVAAGNVGTNPNAIYMPAIARSAITVGSINKNKEISGFSSRGPVLWNGETINKPDLVAPGEGYPPLDNSHVPSPSPDPRMGICSSKYPGSIPSVDCLDGTHRSLKGTSMAAPVVAGLAALYKQKYPNATAAEIKFALTRHATSLGLDVNTQGWGMVDASKLFDFTTQPKTESFIATSFQDSYVDSDKPGTNFGNSGRMRVDGSPKKISYMKFDLMPLEGKRVISARIKLNIPTNESSGSTNRDFNLRRVGVSSWSEDKINFKNKPALGPAVASFNGKGSGSVIDVDLTSFVSSNLGKKVSLALTNDGSNDLILMTREATSTRPRIVIEYQ